MERNVAEAEEREEMEEIETIEGIEDIEDPLVPRFHQFPRCPLYPSIPSSSHPPKPGRCSGCHDGDRSGTGLRRLPAAGKAACNTGRSAIGTVEHVPAAHTRARGRAEDRTTRDRIVPDDISQEILPCNLRR
jgi:hypothetical protein